MSSWKKHFKPASNSALPIQTKNTSGYASAVSKYNTWLPEVYMGPPNRLERYIQYEQMDLDHEVNTALDTIAEFSTQPDGVTGLPLNIKFIEEPTETELKILTKSLKRWIHLNKFEDRLFGIFRSTIMYGDQFFIRDPETYELYWVDPHKVEKIIVNESKGKEIETYFIKDVDLNTAELVGSNVTNKIQIGYGNTASAFPQATMGINPAGPYASANNPSQNGSLANSEAMPINAKHIVHFSMTEGMNSAWPFGTSELETIFKVYKQKEMLEDAMLIYRIHRAPERRVFIIDTGNLPPNKAQQVLERVKYEVQQKRIPNKTGGGSNILDSSYNPLSTLEDYYFAQSADGRGSKVDVLPGGSNLGEIDDMRYFNNKMMRALGVPSSYLPTGPDDGTAGYNDGRVGTAYIQEFRFSERCKRHQRQIVKTLDKEFKLYLKFSGITIDNSIFNITFVEPQNFAKYRQIDMDSAQVAVFNGIADVPYISKRFALKRYLGWGEAEILENEKMYAEEQSLKNKRGKKADAGMRQVGISPAALAGVGEFDTSAVSDSSDFGGDDIVDDIDLDQTVEDFGKE
ncbi:portal vertex protein [Pseudomonas phage vB_Pa-PAC2]